MDTKLAASDFTTCHIYHISSHEHQSFRFVILGDPKKNTLIYSEKNKVKCFHPGHTQTDSPIAGGSSFPRRWAPPRFWRALGSWNFSMISMKRCVACFGGVTVMFFGKLQTDLEVFSWHSDLSKHFVSILQTDLAICVEWFHDSRCTKFFSTPNTYKMGPGSSYNSRKTYEYP